MEKEARELEKKAEQLQNRGFFSTFFGGDKTDDIINYYSMAANKFKLAHMWKEASACLIRTAGIYKQNHEDSFAANTFVEAANVAVKYDQLEAIGLIQEAVLIYTNLGRFSNCGKCEKKMAEIYESLCDYDNAAARYKKAAYYFDMDEYSKCLYTESSLKYAALVAQYNRAYEEAIQIFEKEADKALKIPMLQFGARDYFFRAGLLHVLMGDLVNARLSIDKYATQDPKFAQSRECKFLLSLLEAVQEKDKMAMAELIDEYDRVSSLDNWKNYILFKIKHKTCVDDSVECTNDGFVDLT